LHAEPQGFGSRWRKASPETPITPSPTKALRCEWLDWKPKEIGVIEDISKP
jgi:hypothetical protein